MGNAESKPESIKYTTHAADDRLAFASSCLQGWRPYMEDFHAAIPALPNTTHSHFCPHPYAERYSFFGVYDGHRGNRVAHFVSRRLHWKVAGEDAFRERNFPEALRRGFISLDAELLQGGRLPCRATMGGHLTFKLYCASAGDSRCVLGSNGKAIPMSYDHKPEYPEEEARIMKAGGHVSDGRVNGRLATSRSFGDFDFKSNKSTTIDDQVVTARPDVWERTVTEDDEFLILATDGIWDVLTSQAAVTFVRYHLAQGVSIQDVSEKLLDRCIAVNPAVYELTHGGGAGCDNMTVIIVALLRGKTMQSWQSMIAQRWASLEKPPVVDHKPAPPSNKRTACLCFNFDSGDSAPPPTQMRARGDRPPVYAAQPQMQAPKTEDMEMAAADGADAKEVEALMKRPMTVDDLNLTFIDIQWDKFPHFSD
ncbi:protein phosphatase 2C Ptc2 [Hyaloraphidium curvatum]|nr:protein phosphatase 2C Ptc2 [Hyaloraphidium curvatum]